MGAAIGERLIGLGHELAVWNRTVEKTRTLAAAGAGVAVSPSQLASSSETIITILTDAAAIDAAYRGRSGLLSADVSGKLFIEMSTVRPETERALAADIRNRGAVMVECPVGGTVGPAREGKLFGFVGGESADVARARPLLEKMCRRIEHVGPVGAGASMKLAINLPLLVFWQAFGEALALCRLQKIPDKGQARHFAGGGAVQVAPQPALADAPRDHISVIHVVLYPPVRERGYASAAGDQLQDGYRQFCGAAPGMDFGGFQHATDQVDALFGHRISDERFFREVARGEIALCLQPVVGRHYSEHFKAKQRVVDDAPPRLVLRSDHQIGLVVGEQRERVGMKARYQIEFHLRPVLAKSVHDRHQPVEASVAFEDDAQRSRRLANEFRQIALGSPDFAHHRARQCHQPLTRLGKLY